MRRLLTFLVPRRGSVLAAVLAIGGAIAYAVSEEPPVGAVHGRAYLIDSGRPVQDADIVLTPTGMSFDERKSRRVVTSPDGTFSIAHVEAGPYEVSASTRAHEATGAVVVVDEGETATTELALERSRPSLELAQHQWTFSTREKARIAVRGYVDSTKGALDSVRLEAYRTRLSTMLMDKETAVKLEEVGRSYDAPPGLPDELLRPPHAAPPAKTVSHDLPITTADREGFFYQRIDLGQLPTGLYLIDLSHKEARPHPAPAMPGSAERRPPPSDGVFRTCAWVLVTDTALVAKSAGSQMLAFAADLQSGSSIAGCEVRAFQNGRVRASALTDSRGLANLLIPQAPHRHPASASDSSDESDESDSDETDSGTPVRTTIVATHGDDEAVIGQDFNQSEDHGQFAVHSYTDRPIYRPGQRIAFKSILRRSVEPGARYAVPVDQPVDVEVRDPNGERILKERLTTNSYGSIFGQVDLDSEAPTGVYSYIATAQGEKHTHDIVVASYKKPEFSLTVKPAKARYVSGEQVEMTVEGRFYFGAPVSGAEVSYSVYTEPDWALDYPDDYDYDPETDSASRTHFGDEEEYYGEHEISGHAVLDENGRAVIRFPASIKDSPGAPQAETYTLHANVTDESGREVTADGGVQVSAGTIRVLIEPDGYLALPGRPASVTVTTKDFDGKPVPGVSVQVRSSFEEWKHGEHVVEGIGSLQAVTGPDGKATITVTPPKGGEIRLAASARDPGGRTVRDTTYLWASSDEGGDYDTTYADLSLFADKRRYNPGDTARVLVNAVRTGQTLLLTVEGDRLYRSWTVPMTRKSTVVSVPILADWGPNVFLSACYVRDKHFASSDATLRVAMPASSLTVRVSPDRPPQQRLTRGPGDDKEDLPRYGPGDRIGYTIQTLDSRGRGVPAEVSLGVVDESIYALREDDPARLRSDFYPKRANQVTTAYSFSVEYLGDADKAEPLITARKRFPDTAYWNPTILTDSTGRAAVSFSLPDNLTTWRATVVAHTLGTALGTEDCKVIAAKDFLVRVETPRFLTQRDSTRIQAIVHNDTGSRQTALVRIKAQDPSPVRIDDAATHTLTIEPGRTAQTSWSVTAEGIGKATLTVTAWTPKESGKTQYTDGVETSLPIRPHGREKMEGFAGELTAAHPETEVVRLDPAAIPGASKLTIRITPSIAGAIMGGLDYLVGYPYGCVEQTMSKMLPDLLVQRAARKAYIPLDPEVQRGLPSMVRTGLTRLYRYQHESGAWGWWEHDQDDAWMTAYALYGLATAKESGYRVSPRVLKRGIEAAVKMAGKVNPEDRAFLLYTVALAGGRDAALQNRGIIDTKTADPESYAYAILLNRLLGDPAGPEALSSRALLDRLGAGARSDGVAVFWDVPAGIWNWSSRSATAAALRAILAVNPQDSRIPFILRWLMAKRTDGWWYTTRDTSAVLSALADYVERQAGPEGGGEVRVRLNGRLLSTIPLTPETLREKEVVIRVDSAQLAPGKNEVVLERAGGRSAVFYGVQLRQTVASEDIPAAGGTVATIQREYLRVIPNDSGRWWSVKTEATGGTLRQGDQVRVRIKIHAPRDMEYVLIEDPFPSGCEVTERGTAGEEVDEWRYWYANVDVRDDRIAFFARDLSKGDHVIEYSLRAQTPGSYHALPAILEPMYSPDLHAESAEARVTVR